MKKILSHVLNGLGWFLEMMGNKLTSIGLFIQSPIGVKMICSIALGIMAGIILCGVIYQLTIF